MFFGLWVEQHLNITRLDTTCVLNYVICIKVRLLKLYYIALLDIRFTGYGNIIIWQNIYSVFLIRNFVKRHSWFATGNNFVSNNIICNGIFFLLSATVSHSAAMRDQNSRYDFSACGYNRSVFGKGTSRKRDLASTSISWST